jgi:hypothetical protein
MLRGNPRGKGKAFMSNSMQFPFLKGERQFPALSAYLLYNPQGESRFIIGPSGQGSADCFELEPINLWLEKAYGVSFGICHLAEWHARDIIQRHKVNHIQRVKIHLELNYNPDQPVLLNRL